MFPGKIEVVCIQMGGGSFDGGSCSRKEMEKPRSPSLDRNHADHVDWDNTQNFGEKIDRTSLGIP